LLLLLLLLSLPVRGLLLPLLPLLLLLLQLPCSSLIITNDREHLVR
jgi:hypothetical protein